MSWLEQEWQFEIRAALWCESTKKINRIFIPFNLQLLLKLIIYWTFHILGKWFEKCCCCCHEPGKSVSEVLEWWVLAHALKELDFLFTFSFLSWRLTVNSILRTNLHFMMPPVFNSCFVISLHSPWRWTTLLYRGWRRWSKTYTPPDSVSVTVCLALLEFWGLLWVVSKWN